MQPSSSNGPGVEDHDHQQIATVAQVVTATMMESYADTSAVGARFHPTGWELIFYLQRKYARQQLPVDFIKEFDVYQAHPETIKGRRHLA